MTKQQHEPLTLFRGSFTGAQKNCTGYEKEAGAIMQTFALMDYFLWGALPVHVFTDYRNLLYVFAPLALHPNSPRHAPSKVYQWAIHLSSFAFVIDRKEGANNSFVEVLTRWFKGYRNTRAQQTNVVAALFDDMVLAVKDLENVSLGAIIEEQDKRELTDQLEKDKGDMYKENGKIKISNDAVNIKFLVIVEGHCEERGHRAYEVTLEKIRATYWWNER